MYIFFTRLVAQARKVFQEFCCVVCKSCDGWRPVVLDHATHNHCIQRRGVAKHFGPMQRMLGLKTSNIDITIIIFLFFFPFFPFFFFLENIRIGKQEIGHAWWVFSRTKGSLLFLLGYELSHAQ
jgi:hypothetical protein